MDFGFLGRIWVSNVGVLGVQLGRVEQQRQQRLWMGEPLR